MFRSTPLKGFGYALSKEEVDIDKNQFNDMVVGAPFSDSAVLLKSRPVLSFKPDIKIEPIDAVDPKNKGKTKLLLLSLHIDTFCFKLQSLP